MPKLWQAAIVASAAIGVCIPFLRSWQTFHSATDLGVGGRGCSLRGEMRRAASNDVASAASADLATRQSAEVEQIATKLDAYLAKSVVDEGLSTKIVEDFRRVVGPKSPYEVLKVDCGAHFCRLVTQTSNGDLQSDLGHLLSGHEPFNHGVLYRYDHENRPPRTTLYVARAGEDMLGLARAD